MPLMPLANAQKSKSRHLQPLTPEEVVTPMRHGVPRQTGETVSSEKGLSPCELAAPTTRSLCSLWEIFFHFCLYLYQIIPTLVLFSHFSPFLFHFYLHNPIFFTNFALSFPTVTRRSPDGHPTVARRWDDNQPSVTRWSSDGHVRRPNTMQIRHV